jgi:transcription initiation factor TFIID subunit 12
MSTGANPAMQAATGQVSAAMAAGAAANRQAQAAPTAVPQAPIKSEPGSQQPQAPPPVNTNVAAVGNSVRMPSAGTPTQPNNNTAAARIQTPQTAAPATAAGGVKPLSHSKALDMANQRHDSTHSIPTSAGPNQPGAPGANTTPGSATMPGSATQPGHPHGHPPPNSALQQSKMPIPKVLPENATKVPQPVAALGGVQPGRPTMSGGTGIAGGGLAQPAISKMPMLQFETEGEHVIKKKKLDELVRQVCGGGQPGQDGNYLTPDVEEVGTT